MPMGVHRLLTICLENYSFQTVFRDLPRPPASMGGGVCVLVERRRWRVRAADGGWFVLCIVDSLLGSEEPRARAQDRSN